MTAAAVELADPVLDGHCALRGRRASRHACAVCGDLVLLRLALHRRHAKVHCRGRFLCMMGANYALGSLWLIGIAAAGPPDNLTRAGAAGAASGPDGLGGSRGVEHLPAGRWLCPPLRVRHALTVAAPLESRDQGTHLDLLAILTGARGMRGEATRAELRPRRRRHSDHGRATGSRHPSRCWTMRRSAPRRWSRWLDRGVRLSGHAPRG
mmetsp:Transcript_100263/g.223928  ORF Transcript_100263/g.223928 Transcript_100263/m.223928 type:complete len:209 (+) Transcript_100263:100-726(+)